MILVVLIPHLLGYTVDPGTVTVKVVGASRYVVGRGAASMPAVTSLIEQVAESGARGLLQRLAEAGGSNALVEPAAGQENFGELRRVAATGRR
ncbi:hypothetical protein Nm8I071_36960 [Nonomuraea sp. TT08I-71]|nr:hypothetical protein Nm8I071_36960 [Nonomuraea sp. TT08I-71]